MAGWRVISFIHSPSISGRSLLVWHDVSCRPALAPVHCATALLSWSDRAVLLNLPLLCWCLLTGDGLCGVRRMRRRGQHPPDGCSGGPAGGSIRTERREECAHRPGRQGTCRGLWGALQLLLRCTSACCMLERRGTRVCALVRNRRAGDCDRAVQCAAGTGKVACVGCLCTGKKVAREHDIRLDPFF
jgi:hypothetical protein